MPGNENQMQGNDYNDNNKDAYNHNINYYNYVEAASFKGYNVTTTNPGTSLLVFTFVSCLACFALVILAFTENPIRRFINNIMGCFKNADATENRYSMQDDDMSTLDKSRLAYRVPLEIHGDRQVANIESNVRPRTANSRSSDRTERFKLERQRGRRGKQRYTSSSLRKIAVISVNGDKITRVERRGLHKQNGFKQTQTSESAQHRTIKRQHGYRRSNAASGALTFEDLGTYLVRFDGTKNLAELSDEPLDNTSVSSESTIHGDKTMLVELKKICGWAAPWLVQSLVSYGSDMITVILISHFMGLRAMICYSHVWYITEVTHVLPSAWYSAIYKHINIACSLETVEGYQSAGNLIRIGVVGNILISIPIAICTVIFMPNMMNLLGYDGAIVVLAQEYALVAVISWLISSSSSLVYSILDLEGYAKYTAVYEFWENAVSLVLTYSFIIQFSPSLLALGIFHLVIDILSTSLYFSIAYQRGWYEGYLDGMLSPIESWWNAQMKSIAIIMVPLIGGEIVGNIEGVVLTIFAAYQGNAEAGTWILMSYVWSFVELVPSCFAEATSVRLVRHLSKARIDFAKELCVFAIKIGTFISIICSGVLYVWGNFFVWCLSLDETLEGMLLEVIPYIVICQPFVSVGIIVDNMNDSLHIYNQTTLISTLVTVLFMLPFGALMTYYFNYNIEGLAATMCIGYTAMGVASIIIFMKADWERAVRKAQVH